MPVCKGLFALVLLNGVAFTGALRGLLQLPVQIAALMLHPLAMTSATSPQLGFFSNFASFAFQSATSSTECTAMLDGFSCSFDHPSAASWIPVCCVENPNVQTSLVLLV